MPRTIVGFAQQLPPKDRLKEFLAVAGIGLLLATVLLMRTNGLIYDHPSFIKPWDHHKYIHMASSNPLDFHIAPFCWRIAKPLLASLLPFDLQWNFLMINFISIWMTGVTVYYLVKKANFPRVYALTGMLMFFALGWAAKFALYDFWLPDAPAFLIMTLGVYCILAKQDLAFAALLAAGVTVKESAFFIAPLYYTLNAKKIVDLRVAKRFVLFTAPAVVVLIALRALIPQMNNDLAYISKLPDTLRLVQTGQTYYDYWTLLKVVGLGRFRTLTLDILSSYSVGTFGVMVMLLPFFAVRKNMRWFFKFAPFFLLVYSQLLFAVHTERLLAIGFPAMILLAINGISAINETFFLKPPLLLSLPLTFFVLNVIAKSSITSPVAIQFLVFVLWLALSFQLRGKDVAGSNLELNLVGWKGG